MSTHSEVPDASGVRLFTRQATGLRRDVSPLSQLVFCVFTAPTPFILTIALFWILGAFPGANLYVALIGGYLAGIVFCFAVSLVSAAIPRTGGDYIFVGRIIKPIVGTISSFCFTAGVLLSAAAISLFVTTVALAPSLLTIGLTTNSGTLTEWGTTLSTDKGWQYAVTAVFIILAAIVAGSGWKWSLRVQTAGAILGFIGLFVTAIVVLANSGSDFISAFNGFAQPLTNEKDTYHQIVTSTREAGVNVEPGSHFSNTWPAFGAVMGFSIYAFYSTNIGSEVQQPRAWKTTWAMLGATAINGILAIVMTAILFHGFGSEFFTAANAGESWPLAAPPTYTVLASIAGGSGVLSWFLGISIVSVFFVVLWLQFVQPMRALFAYSFDGLIPIRISQVSAQTRVPVVALTIVTVAMLGLLVWAVWGGGFFTVYANAVLMTCVALILMSLSVIVFAHRRPQIWAGSVANGRVGGVPITTLAGIGALIVSILVTYFYLHYEGLGIADTGEALRNVAIVVVGAILVYVIADKVRATQGIRLSQTAEEIPPE